MWFVARRPFIWEGQKIAPGDPLEIPERHPRLDAMLRGRFIGYDSASDVPTGAGAGAPQLTGRPG